MLHKLLFVNHLLLLSILFSDLLQYLIGHNPITFLYPQPIIPTPIIYFPLHRIHNHLLLESILDIHFVQSFDPIHIHILLFLIYQFVNQIDVLVVDIHPFIQHCLQYFLFTLVYNTNIDTSMNLSNNCLNSLFLHCWS